MKTVDVTIPAHADWQTICVRTDSGDIVRIFRNEDEKRRWDREQAEMLEEALRMNF